MKTFLVTLIVLLCVGCNSSSYGHIKKWKLNQIKQFSLAKLSNKQYVGIRIDLKNMSHSEMLSKLSRQRGESSMVGFVNEDGNFVLIEEDLGHAGIWGYVQSDIDLLALSKDMNPMLGHSSYSPFVDVTEYIGDGWYKCNSNID